MVPAAHASAALVAGTSEPLKVLDIAAGHGLFGLTIAQRNPRARIVAADWPSVLAVATEHARAAPVEDRYQVLAGDAFKVDFPDGFDVALVTQQRQFAERTRRPLRGTNPDRTLTRR